MVQICSIMNRNYADTNCAKNRKKQRLSPPGCSANPRTICFRLHTRRVRKLECKPFDVACVRAVWTLPFMHTGSICFPSRCASCVDWAFLTDFSTTSCIDFAKKISRSVIPGVVSWPSGGFMRKNQKRGRRFLCVSLPGHRNKVFFSLLPSDWLSSLVWKIIVDLATQCQNMIMLVMFWLSCAVKISWGNNSVLDCCQKLHGSVDPGCNHWL